MSRSQSSALAPSLAARLGRSLIIVGVVVGVALLVVEPSGQGMNPGPGLVGLGLALLVIGRIGRLRRVRRHEEAVAMSSPGSS